MKRRTGMLLLLTSFLALVHAQAATLPDSCGSDTIKFNVANQKGQSASMIAEAGMARVTVIETSAYVSIGKKVTIRVGMDGNWIGADNGNSYLTFSVPPGEHHLCANWQSSVGSWDKTVGLQPFNAEAGQTYYFHAKVTLSKDYVDFALLPLNDDQAKYMLKTSELSVSTPKK